MSRARPGTMPERKALGEALSKTVLATFILMGIFLLWLGLLLASLAGGYLGLIGRAVGVTGSLFAAAVALLGALGSRRTTDYQTLGLLVVSAALVLTAALVT